MEKIYLLVSKNNKNTLPIIKDVVNHLTNIGGVVYCIPDKAEHFKEVNVNPIPDTVDKKDIFLAISFGGDGTILKAAKYLYGTDVPILGINLGTLGYLSDVEPKEAIEAIDKYINGNSTIEKRYALSIKYAKYEDVAINEAVIYRGTTSHIIKTKIKINGQETMNIRVDGILVSTPTGSTAYNLSAGGPIITPLSKTVVLTPICAHSLSARPIVVADDSIIEINVEKNEHDEFAYLDVDGKNVARIDNDCPIYMKIACKSISLVRTKDYNFFERLQNKLMLINQ
ncbi:MAG: NAD(+)/NADH kinase [Clostridia bacterium]|nr:NAD(+)/NADH kinase [Clostridia bacterium]